MNELLEKDQVISIVPQNFRNSNKGKVINILEKSFVLELFHKLQGIESKKIMEFYSQTKHGTLYFSSAVAKVDGNNIIVLMPKKHRFLQRRTFSRINFSQDIELKLNDKFLKAQSIDLSAGGMKIKTSEAIDINSNYYLKINLPNGDYIENQYQPIKIERLESNNYVVSGRFLDLSSKDKMKIVQFCMRKNIEKDNR